MLTLPFFATPSLPSLPWRPPHKGVPPFLKVWWCLLAYAPVWIRDISGFWGQPAISKGYKIVSLAANLCSLPSNLSASNQRKADLMTSLKPTMQRAQGVVLLVSSEEWHQVFYLNIFTVSKLHGGIRPIWDSKSLNRFLLYQHFRWNLWELSLLPSEKGNFLHQMENIKRKCAWRLESRHRPKKNITRLHLKAEFLPK